MNDEIKKLKAAAEKVAHIRADIKAFDGDKRGMLSALEDATDEYHELVCRFPILTLIERAEAAEHTSSAGSAVVMSDAAPDTSQEWAKLDGATAFHLIERHAEDWNETGRMMESWLAARLSAAAAQPAPTTAQQPVVKPWHERMPAIVTDWTTEKNMAL